ncbi:hypothetical protein ACYSNU_00015 [Enterococcus sp. LJL120]
MSDGIQFLLILSLLAVLFIVAKSFAKRSNQINKETAYYFWQLIAIIALILITLILIVIIYILFIWQPAVIDLK